MFMECSVYQRIREFIEDNKISISKLSGMIGVPQTTLNRQLSGVGEIPYYTIEQLVAMFPNLSAEWLLRGKGEMYLQSNSDNLNQSASDLEKLREENLRLQGEIRALERLIQGEKKATVRRNVG